MKIAFVFPGQGSQKVGMGAQLIEDFSACQTLADIAKEQVAAPFLEAMLEGPIEQLTVTSYTQPALLTVGTMIANELMHAGIRPDYVAGHSLGEYTALVAANVLSFEDGVRAVYERGLHMEAAVPQGQGAMAAVLGSDSETIENIAAQVNIEHPVQLANYNCPGQVVLSGTTTGVQLASEQLKEQGVRRIIPLQVSGPFHSSLMKEAAKELAETLRTVDFSPATIPVVANVNAEVVTDPKQIEEQLIQQLYSPVLWEQSVRQLIDLGVTHFIECGPGKVLNGLIKKIDRQVHTFAIEDTESLQFVIEELRGECSEV